MFFSFPRRYESLRLVDLEEATKHVQLLRITKQTQELVRLRGLEERSETQCENIRRLIEGCKETLARKITERRQDVRKVKANTERSKGVLVEVSAVGRAMEERVGALSSTRRWVSPEELDAESDQPVVIPLQDLRRLAMMQKRQLALLRQQVATFAAHAQAHASPYKLKTSGRAGKAPPGALVAPLPPLGPPGVTVTSPGGGVGTSRGGGTPRGVGTPKAPASRPGYTAAAVSPRVASGSPLLGPVVTQSPRTARTAARVAATAGRLSMSAVFQRGESMLDPRPPRAAAAPMT